MTSATYNVIFLFFLFLLNILYLCFYILGWSAAGTLLRGRQNGQRFELER